MFAEAKPDKVRDRILKTAGELFYFEGINATGVDRISEVAGVSKRSLYQRFASKDKLVADYLAVAGAAFVDGVMPPEDDDTTPRERMLAVFSRLQAESLEPRFRGCPCINAAAELADAAHPARATAVENKLWLQEFFTRQATLAGALDPHGLAQQLTMVFDGGVSYALVRNAAIPDSCYAAAETLIEAQLPH
ncbi:TetR/AcrR family transcriptional regulator [Microbispora sp. RL4-1S]|uniref:TetR/AcrR family transcriptional regulator n=1 Tax=Microbispora oryzae TaxID=2806554 RepID=A0A941AKG7_9ACTN|nr:TetR/AcrR family transcriptional regulator [Microbispora oryzae]MBP2707186.1 TetR/AcrR family transcriptional regulator [Microbispora oryzae]